MHDGILIPFLVVVCLLTGVNWDLIHGRVLRVRYLLSVHADLAMPDAANCIFSVPLFSILFSYYLGFRTSFSLSLFLFLSLLFSRVLCRLFLFCHSASI